MKKFLAVLLAVLPGVVLAQYSYRGAEITSKRFDALYNQCGKYIFTDGQKFYDTFTVTEYWMATHESEFEKKNVKNYKEEIKGSKDYAYMHFKVKKILPDKSIIAGELKEGRIGLYCNDGKTYHVKGNIPNGTDERDKIVLPVIQEDNTFPYENSQLPELTTLQAIDKKQFAEYLKGGAVLYEMKKTVKTPNEKCPECKGKGKVKDKNKMDGKPCPKCNGKGYIGEAKEFYEKVEVK